MFLNLYIPENGLLGFSVLREAELPPNQFNVVGSV